MTSTNHMLDRVLARYARRAKLKVEDIEAFLSLPYEIVRLPTHAYLVREGDRPKTAKLVIDGLAYRHKITIEGARQIISVHIPGDFVDLEGSLLDIADHNVQALSDCTLLQFPKEPLIRVVESHGTLARAMWVDTLIDASIYREWVVNVGRRDARQATCHLLCEFGRRLESIGQGYAGSFELPMTQEQLGDALGISPVHVNRVLRDLDREGLVVRNKRSVQVPDLARLKKVGGFNELYLHLEQGTIGSR